MENFVEMRLFLTDIRTSDLQLSVPAQELLLSVNSYPLVFFRGRGCTGCDIPVSGLCGLYILLGT